MKKVMLLIVGIFFAGSASAATLTLSGANPLGGTPGASQTVSAVNNGGDLATASGDTTGEIEWYSWFNLTTDVDTNAIVTWTFNPEANLTSATVGIGSDSLGSYFELADITSNFVTSFVFLAGENYWIDIFSANSGGLDFALSVQAVPIPAALFLLAPALLGFFGLRRKATAVAAA